MKDFLDIEWVGRSKRKSYDGATFTVSKRKDGYGMIFRGGG